MVLHNTRLPGVTRPGMLPLWPDSDATGTRLSLRLLLRLSDRGT